MRYLLNLFFSAPRSKEAMHRLFTLAAGFGVSHILRLSIPLASIVAVSYSPGPSTNGALLVGGYLLKMVSTHFSALGNWSFIGAIV